MRVLVIDDDDAIRAVLERGLGAEGFEVDPILVLTAKSGDLDQIEPLCLADEPGRAGFAGRET